ncbi:hypothetical protein AVEN_192294-1 [Araneus ventricosus]|uniref:Uncharacterized protein n=1 Tax=Araneus ventricosus TaxID=182803 RepID=A0A4Y2G9R1_ARAVE|nr:hypothetical protein AVEN_192294-1 [Araneus ventricosus]
MKSRKQFTINRIRIESNDVIAKSIFSSQSLSGRVVRASGLETVGSEFYPRLCSYSVFAIVCNEFDVANLTRGDFEADVNVLQVVSSLHSCHVKFVERLLQLCCKLKLLSGQWRNAGGQRVYRCPGEMGTKQ